MKAFGATTILPPINGFFFCVQCGSECSEIFWVSWSKKNPSPVGAGPVGQHGSFVGQTSFFKDSRHLKECVFWFVMETGLSFAFFFISCLIVTLTIFIYSKIHFFFRFFFSFSFLPVAIVTIYLSSCDFFYLVFM